MNNWYDEYILLGVRELVKLLRNNGINTRCSCHHLWYIECDTLQPEDVDTIRRILFNLGFDEDGFRITRSQIVTSYENTDRMYIDLKYLKGKTNDN